MRVRCPICDQSTDGLDAYCQFCGAELRKPTAADEAALARRAAAAAPTRYGQPATAAAVDSDMKDKAELAMLLAVGSLFFAILAPAALVIGLQVNRTLAERGKPSIGFATAATWIGGCGTLVLTLAVGLIVIALLMAR